MTAIETSSSTALVELKLGSDRNYEPLVDRNSTNGMTGAELQRDRIYELVRNAAHGRGVDLTIVTSDPFVAPPKVTVDCWVRHVKDPLVTLRSSAIISVRPREFHRFHFEYDIEYRNDVRKQSVRNIIKFSQADADALVDYLLSITVRRPPRMSQRRSWKVDLWRPQNRPDRLRLDPLAIVAIGLVAGGFLTLGFGIGFLLLPAGLLLAYFNHRRRTHCLSAGKPTQEPRRPIRLDSWQVVIDKLGQEVEALREQIISEIRGIPGQGLEVGNERIWYWGSDGKEEREQTVVRLGRGLLFLHIYRYGESVYVGWDAHVNCGEWTETIAGRGYDMKTATLCAVHSITAGWHIPNEYDITDTNCLIEQVHSIVSRCVKLKAAELKIDQEIDFKIVREARGGITGRQDPDESASTTIKSKLRRLA